MSTFCPLTLGSIRVSVLGDMITNTKFAGSLAGLIGVLEDKFGNEAANKCIQDKVFSVEYPKVDPKTPCVQLVHPMTFP